MSTAVNVEIPWERLPQMEEHILTAVSLLPKERISEAHFTLGRSARGVYLRIKIEPIPLPKKATKPSKKEVKSKKMEQPKVVEKVNENDKGIQCELTTGGIAHCRSVEFQKEGKAKRHVGLQTDNK